jgi:hypothetical protein
VCVVDHHLRGVATVTSILQLALPTSSDSLLPWPSMSEFESKMNPTHKVEHVDHVSANSTHSSPRQDKTTKNGIVLVPQPTDDPLDPLVRDQFGIPPPPPFSTSCSFLSSSRLSGSSEKND